MGAILPYVAFVFVPPKPRLVDAWGRDVTDDPSQRLGQPGAVTAEDVVLAIASGALPRDSEPARLMAPLLPFPGWPRVRPGIPDYLQRVAEAVQAYAEWLASRLGGGAQVDAFDPRRWSDAALRLPDEARSTDPLLPDGVA